MFIIKKLRISNKQDEQSIMPEYLKNLFNIEKSQYVKNSDPIFMQKAYQLFHLNIQS